MFVMYPSKLKRYQRYAAIAGSLGFVLGIAIPTIGIMLFGWRCPFGTGTLQTVVFAIVTGFCSALLFGNLIAFLLVGIAKYITHKPRKKKEI